MLSMTGEVIVGRNMLDTFPDVVPHSLFVPTDLWLKEGVGDAVQEVGTNVEVLFKSI